MVILPDDLPYKTIDLIWSHDLDSYIEKHLGRPWSLGQNGDGYGQETITTFEVYRDSAATIEVEEWLSSPPANCPGRVNQPGFAESVEIYTETILNELCNRGLLPEGGINVHSWW